MQASSSAIIDLIKLAMRAIQTTAASYRSVVVEKTKQNEIMPTAWQSKNGEKGSLNRHNRK